MNYFSVEFDYPGPYVNFPGPDPETASAWAFEELIESRLEAIDIQWRHAYSWPDGSCYKFVRTEMDKQQLKIFLNQALIPTRCRIKNVMELESSSDPDKSGHKTLEEYFSNESRIEE